MAQVQPAYRRLADRAQRQWAEARRRRLPPDVVSYLKENYEAWNLIDHNLTLTTMMLKSLGTSRRSLEMMELTAAKADIHLALIPPEDGEA